METIIIFTLIAIVVGQHIWNICLFVENNQLKTELKHLKSDKNKLEKAVARLKKQRDKAMAEASKFERNLSYAAGATRQGSASVFGEDLTSRYMKSWFPIASAVAKEPVKPVGSSFDSFTSSNSLKACSRCSVELTAKTDYCWNCGKVVDEEGRGEDSDSKVVSASKVKEFYETVVLELKTGKKSNKKMAAFSFQDSVIVPV